jgi:hypothetical protein
MLGTWLTAMILQTGSISGTQAPAFSVDALADGSTLVVNEVEVLTLRSARGGMSAAQRAASASVTLSAIPSASSLEAIPPVAPSRDWRLGWDQRTVVTVTEAEARAHSSTPQALAVRWAAGLQKALSLDPLTVNGTSFQTPPDKPMRLSLTGSAARKAQLSLVGASLVEVRRRRGEVVFIPRRTGTATAVFKFGAFERSVNLSVFPYALTFPMTVQASVLGSPAPAATVMKAARSALGQVPLPPGGKLTVLSLPERSLASGSQVLQKAKVKAEAPNTYPVEGEIDVRLINAGLMPRAEKELWYSNVPENVNGPQRLYWGSLPPGQTVRLLAHHKNVSKRNLDLAFSLGNPTDTPMQVGLSMGDARPDPNPTLAGYVAGDGFMREWMARSGVVLNLPPKSWTPIILRRVAPEDTMSALAQIHLMPNAQAPVLLAGDAIAAGALPEPWRTGGTFPYPWGKLDPLKWDAVSPEGTPKHVYAPPIRTERFVHRVGGRFTFIRVGEKAIDSTVDNSYETLLGNFGVHYSIEGEVVNPTPTPQDVEIVFEASAGYSGALFLVDGVYMPARLLQGKAEFVLWRRRMNPGDSVPVSIQTIPLSGAHYPCTIIIRPKGSTL